MQYELKHLLLMGQVCSSVIEHVFVMSKALDSTPHDIKTSCPSPTPQKPIIYFYTPSTKSPEAGCVDNVLLQQERNGAYA